MKIRKDFVTNSSSVSFILCLKKDIADIYKRQYEGSRSEEQKIVFDAIYKKVLEEGERVYIDGEELYAKKLKFNTDGDCMWHDSYDNFEEVDFKNMPTEELWNYINGEYILTQKISSFEGISAIQVDTY
ncbi:MAG: hypothetical protein PHR25_05915 [Clostridia bacterium]|nr:hypothetical protein [Clostridia bacterium]